MNGIAHSIQDLIGNTPLICFERFARDRGLLAEIDTKLELFNPAGSAKDRAALYMIMDAEEKGLLHAGSVIVEPTSGNTGIGLAAVASARGYRVILTMPDTMSSERIALLKAYGAEIILTPGKEGMTGCVNKAAEIAENTPGSFIPSQFDNPANPRAHYCTTGPEIWRDTRGNVDIFVCCVGTGGTFTGVARYLKEKNPALLAVAVEPASSPLLSQGHAGPHKIQGIGANFVPQNFDCGLADEILTVTDEDAYRAAADIARLEGVLIGISSGAALHAAAVLAGRPENRGKRIVALAPDTGEHYLSTGVFG